MTAIRLQFSASRYHATPWGRHVNEGVVEWPPSPYRLLRALYDVWKRKCPELSEAMVISALEALTERDPQFNLPVAGASHTRSYLSSNSEDPTAKSLIFDAFLAVGKEATCFVIWPDLELDQDQRMTIGKLLENLNYLGRSESWVQAEFHEGKVDGGYRCYPVHEGEGSGEIVPVACVLARRQYAEKQAWLDALTASTTDLLKSRRSGPPLLRMVNYVRPETCIQSDPVTKLERTKPSTQAILISLDDKVLPLATSTLDIAEQIRKRLMGAHKNLIGDPSLVSSLFSGKENGSKRLDHGHLFILPRKNQNDRIDRVLLLSRKRPFTPKELNAVRGMRELWRVNRDPVRCVLSWQGAIDDEQVGTRAKTVVSSTPFVTARHWRKGRDPGAFLEEEIRRECRNHELPEPRTIAPLERLPGYFDCVEYHRNRKDDPPKPGYAVRLRFDGEVATPFSLGYACHFGLGQFDAER